MLSFWSLLALCQNLEQATLDYIAANLGIRYDVLDNFQDTWKSYRVRMTLENSGSEAIPNGPWAIYLCHIRVIEPAHTKHNPSGYVIPGSHGIKVTHINGCQHKFEPTASFSGLAGFQSLMVDFDAENWNVARTDVMPNWYIAAEGLQARTITSTSGEDLSFVGPFDSPKKWKRIPSDKYDPYTPQKRYTINDINNLKKPGQLIIPSPQEILGLDESKKINLRTGDWSIVAGADLKQEASFLAGELGIQMDYLNSFRKLELKMGEVQIGGVRSDSKEAYSLKVDSSKHCISIIGNSPTGVFYGIQSLLSLNEPDGLVPHVAINDAPRYEYRGMELDVGRNFMPKGEVLKMIDAMAMYKLNKFHFHLTDDEGWRLEIPGLPELTEIGSRRCHDPQEEKCLGSQLGSGPGTGNSGTGFYTVNDYREILKYAEERHVEVIPEFDMPGHGHAAIKAMHARQKKQAAMGNSFEADQYLLSDPLDTSKYLSVQFFTDNAINPCLESTYEFLEHIVVSVRHMHQDIQPLKVVLTQATHLYFDHPYEPDPEERGYYWAPRFIDTRKTFGFMPDDVYANADFTRMGDPIINLCEEMYKGKCVPLKKPQNIAGMAGALWSETVRTPTQLQSMIYPRLLALAERAWHKACFEDETDVVKRNRVRRMEWEAFANSLGHKELSRLDKMNIDYHIPPPGARVAHQKIEVNSAIPGLVIQYSADGGKSWSDVGDGMTLSGHLLLGTRLCAGRQKFEVTAVQERSDIALTLVVSHLLETLVSLPVEMNFPVTFKLLLYSAVICPAVDQAYLDDIASCLDIQFDVLSNKAGACHIRLKFTNKGRHNITSGNWAIYFSCLRILSNRADPLVMSRKEISVSHVNGYLQVIKPTKTFLDLVPSGKKKLDLTAFGSIVAKTDVMPNWYITAPGLQPRIIKSTKGESLKFVGSFDSALKWKRSELDNFNPFTPEKRFDMNNVVDLKGPGKLILPTPVVLKNGSSFKMMDLKDGKWMVISQKGLEDEGQYLSEKLKMQLSDGGAPSRKFIELRIGKVTIDTKYEKRDSDESYTMKVDPRKEVVSIVGASPAGVFWAIQSLLSIIRNGKIPWVTVKDAPRYEYRGLSIDVARNFLPTKEVKRILDGMAMFKLNKLHLHLTDDEGWRLEIPGLPELTEVASQRCYDLKETHCLKPQLGSGPFRNTSGSGYYSVEDYKGILKYANARHIQIIPEFDLPGHSTAAITAMEARYKKYLNEGKFKEGLRFYLNDLKDRSSYQSGQFFFNNAVNPCIAATYDFVEKLVLEVKAMHEGVQPLKVIHLGGDEVPVGAWNLSTACQRLSEKFKSRSTHLDWRAFFTKRVARIAKKYGVKLMLWDDGWVDRSKTHIVKTKLESGSSYGHAWGDTVNLGYRLANEGYKVVMSPASHLYFDHAHEPDPEERGLYWATRYTNTRKAFGFMPEHLYDSFEIDDRGEPSGDYCSIFGGCVKPQKLENIIGLAGVIWSETIRTPSQFQSMTFPRLLAVAERAWHQDLWENERNKVKRNKMKNKSWAMFANTLGYKELARLDELGIAYRIPPPGARIDNGVLSTNVAFPGLSVECSIDCGRRWFNPSKQSVISGTLLLRTR
ncbi:unnamed protein product [Pocillopora meandrina]|uniref:beta-N-acetylhexosaminidase n=1 Tax=Pocillopora meandrina TaxID=46732 RepID=A0AAU9XCV7_9CNID|nr:unnamed protein product [Pocillopora meandrina]